MATTHKSTAQGHTDVYPPKSKPTRNKNLAAKQRSLNDEDNKITLDKNKKFRKKKKKENTSDTEKKQSNKSSREEAPNREDSSSPLNSGGDTGDRQPDPKGSSSSNTSTQKAKGSKGTKRSKKSKSSVSSEDAQAASLGPAAVRDKAKEEEVSAEALESLRWVGVLDDPVAEEHRLEVYKANRRKRYIAARQLQLGKTASLLTQP
ncbi:protein LIAT1 [Engraulis encrasicolus]|uniref:protein LIAT1 n=1 Tax=Engraulis encrasicolus TaxID=184585 RepID=UPI002FD69628